MFICTVLILSGLLSRPIVADNFWQEPDAWEINSRSANTDSVCECTSIADGANSITTMYYKELVSHLFNRNTLKVNPETDYLERTITLTLTRPQLTIIESSSDIRDFNVVVMAVLKGAKDKESIPEVKLENESSKFTDILSKLKYICELVYFMLTRVFEFFSFIYCYTSEVPFVTFVCSVMLLIWLIHKKSNKNLIVVIILSLITFGYFFTYIECNRKLKAESFVEFIKEVKKNEPSFLEKVFGKLFKLSERDIQIEEIRKGTQVKLPFCRPDEVALMYFNDMFFKQLQVIVEKIVESMEKIRNTIPFPLNYMGMIALPFLFMSILPLLFQNVFNPALLQSIFRATTTGNYQTNETINNNALQGDRLSGENLKILLDVLKAKTEVGENPKNSAVQDVKDLPQAIASKLDDSFSEKETNDEEKSDDRIGDILEDEKSKKEC